MSDKHKRFKVEEFRGGGQRKTIASHDTLPRAIIELSWLETGGRRGQIVDMLAGVVITNEDIEREREHARRAIVRGLAGTEGGAQ